MSRTTRDARILCLASLAETVLLLLRSPHRHPVADAGLGKYVGGVVGVVAQLAAEPLHHFADQPGFAGPLRPPDPLQQLVVGQHPPGVDRKLDEQLVLGGRQRHRTPGHRHPVSGVVDAQVAQRVGFGRPGPPAQRRPDPGRKLRRREGLDRFRLLLVYGVPTAR